MCHSDTHFPRAYAGDMANTVSLNKTPERRNQLRPIWLHALKAGTHSGQNGVVTITAADIQQIAASYDPALHEAPAVLGHPATDDPAYGWVSGVEVRDDGLWVNADLSPELVAMVDKRQYENLSVSLYPPSSPVNPVPGSYYLKHLGFLGAQPPAVKGLKKVSLSEASDAITINFSQKESPRMDEEELLAKQKEIELAETNLTSERQKLAQEKAAIAERAKAIRTQELTALLDKHVQAGRVLPKDKSLLLAFAEKLDAEPEAVSFSEGEEKAPLLTHFDKFLAGLSPQVELRELAASAAPSEGVKPVQLSVPSGYTVDLTQMELDAKIQAWMAANPGKLYLDAVKAVGV